MPAPKSSASPWAKLDAIMKTTPEPTGPAWFTVGEFATRYHLSNSGASARLAAMTRSKTVERWIGRAAGCHAPKCKFRLKEKQ